MQSTLSLAIELAGVQISFHDLSLSSPSKRTQMVDKAKHRSFEQILCSAPLSKLLKTSDFALNSPLTPC